MELDLLTGWDNQKANPVYRDATTGASSSFRGIAAFGAFRPWYDFVVRHLATAWALLRYYARLIPSDWYRRSPFLPVPPRDYLLWRLQTAYGKRRPPLGTLLRDVWQFGSWLRDS